MAQQRVSGIIEQLYTDGQRPRVAAAADIDSQKRLLGWPIKDWQITALLSAR